MARVTLELLETQVIALVRQLSTQGKQTVMRFLSSELGEPHDEELDGFAEDDDSWDKLAGMDRRQLLAAETFSYSYANYDDHLGIGNVRFDKLMPDAVDTLEQAERQGWDDVHLARAMEVPEDKGGFWREAYRRSVAIVDATTPAESFRRGIRFSIQDAVEEGLSDEGAVERLVTQICYRAADLAYLLDQEGENLSDYSEELREESDYDLGPIDLEDLSEL
jgi:hypothetical protein